MSERVGQLMRRYGFLYLVRVAFEEVAVKVATIYYTSIFRFRCVLKGVRCGRRLEVFGRVLLRSPSGGVTIGDDVQLVSSSWRATAAALNHEVRLRTFLPSATIRIEDGVGLNGTSITARSKKVVVGSGTMIAPNCIIMDSDFHRPWPPQDRRNYSGDDADASVIIGKNVWIGANSIVLKGVSIGENSVIGAGSVIVNSLPPNSLAAGNPARVIKQLGDPSRPE